MFYPSKNGKGGLTAHCKTCQIKRSKKYARENKKKVQANCRAWEARNPEKVLAIRRRASAKFPERKETRLAFQRAIYSGEIVRGPCEVCSSTHKIQGHHHKGYDIEHALDVVWLCSKHHREADNQLRKVGKL